MKKYIVELYDENVRSVDGYDWLQLLISVADKSVMVETAIELLPYTEPDLEQVREEAYEQGKMDAYVEDSKNITMLKKEAEEAYQRGLSDAWEAARKIIHMPEGDLLNIFTECYSAVCTSVQVFLKYDAPEAIEKIKAYQEQIQVGDEVYVEKLQGKAVVMQTGKIMCCAFQNGDTFTPHMKDCKKTGRHFPEIAEVLRKMMEE